MDSKNIVKTTFIIYRFLDKLTRSIDRKIMSRAVNSFYVSEKLLQNGVWEVSEDIIDLMDKKVEFINLKLLVEKSLTLLPRNLSRLLIMKYIDGVSNEFISQRLGLTNRTFFRQVSQALAWASKAMKHLGFEEDRLMDIFQKDKWVMGVLTSVSSNHIDANYISSLTYELAK